MHRQQGLEGVRKDIRKEVEELDRMVEHMLGIFDFDACVCVYHRITYVYYAPAGKIGAGVEG